MSRFSSIFGSSTVFISATVLSALIALYLNNARIELSEDLNAERAQMQNTLEAKDILNKKLISVTADLEEFKAENAELSRANAEKKLTIKSLIAQKKQSAGWTEKSSKQQKEISTLKAELIRLKEESLSVEQGRNTERISLQKRISELESQLAELRARLGGSTIIAANYFRIEALRGKKDRLTRKASRAQRILVSFHAGDELMKAAQSGNLYLTVAGPGTQKLTAANAETVAIQLGDKRVEIPVVAKAKLQKMKEGWQEIVMTTTSRLKPGIYQADVYSDTHHLGGAQIRLD